jgi:hypothetical protein
MTIEIVPNKAKMMNAKNAARERAPREATPKNLSSADP